jgi:hypothetical protein
MVVRKPHKFISPAETWVTEMRVLATRNKEKADRVEQQLEERMRLHEKWLDGIYGPNPTFLRRGGAAWEEKPSDFAEEQVRHWSDGTLLSLRTVRGVRFEGTFFQQQQGVGSVTLMDVRCFGTEGRSRNSAQGTAEVFDQMLFLFADIQHARDKTIRAAADEGLVVS